MLIYEVNLDIARALRGDYLPWLREHVTQMLALPGFVDACILEADSEDDARVAYCVQYRLQDRAALDAYLALHSERMRGDGLRRFGDRVRASRRVLQPLAND